MDRLKLTNVSTCLKFLIIAVVLFLVNSEIQAQSNITITGRVTDSTGKGLEGANVTVVNTRTGTFTDVNGNYSLTFPDTYKTRRISFSYTGMLTQEMAIGNNNTIDIRLQIDLGKTLEDVVVVGYGTQRKLSLTGAVNQISSKQIENKPVTNVLQALQGESPNLIIQQANFNPGSGVVINIRGVGTLGDNSPLVVIDGIIGGDINLLNPNDIASVSVLKDAGSAAIYGSRAANGVLLITTKSGRLNQKPTVSYNGSYGLQTARVLVEKVHAWDNAYYKNEALINAGLPPAYSPDQIQDLKNQGDGNWNVEFLLKKAPMHSHNVSISGGSATNYYFISAGYQNQGSNLIGNGGSGANFGFQKYNLRLNQTSIIGKFKANLILNYTKSRNKSNSVGDNNIFADANRVPLNYNWVDSAGNYLTNAVASQYNEYGVLKNGGFNQSDNDEIFGTINGQFNVTKDIKLTGVFGGTVTSNSNFYRRIQVNYIPGGVYGDDRAVLDNASKSYLINTQLFVEYNKVFGDHAVKAQIGATNESYSGKGFQLQKRFTDQFLGTPTTGTEVDVNASNNSIAVNETSINSFIGRFNYSYKDRYLFEATFREDISSKFAKDNRAGFFPTFNAAWVLSQEHFMESFSKTFNYLKLRATYGVLGNQNVNTYQYQTTYFSYPSAYGFNNAAVGGAGFLLGNPDLTWEKSATANVGIDATLLKNALSISFDYFNKTTKDILQPRQDIPQLYGAASPDYNVAKVRNVGWDATVSYKFTGRNFTQSVAINVADNKNELLELSSGANQLIINQDVYSLLRRVGDPITQWYGYKTNGYFQNTNDVANSPKPVGIAVGVGDLKFVDQNKDGVIDDKDKVVLGYPFPRYTFGFTYRAEYKGFDIQIFFQGVGKRDAFLRGELVEPFHYNYGQTLYTHMTDYWTPNNSDARYPRLATIGSASNTNNWRLGSDLYKYDAAYLRLKNVMIGYTLPQRLSNRVGMEKLRVALVGQNLLTISKLSFVDPETTEFGNNLGINNSSNSVRSYPMPVYFGANLEIIF
jgi:TonB-dependent starch-binding outer membrane protein SusC